MAVYSIRWRISKITTHTTRLAQTHKAHPLERKGAKEGGEEDHTRDDDGRGASETEGGVGLLVSVGAAAAGSGAGLGKLVGGRAVVLRARAVETGARAGALGEELPGLLGELGEQGALNDPVRVLGGALGNLLGGGVAAVALGSRVRGHGLGKGVELGKLLAGAVLLLVRNGDDAVLVLLVGVLVHEAARVDRSHVVAHERSHLAEVAHVLDAAVLGKEDGKAVVLEGLDLLVPARRDKVAGAPRVVVLRTRG